MPRIPSEIPRLPQITSLPSTESPSDGDVPVVETKTASDAPDRAALLTTILDGIAQLKRSGTTADNHSTADLLRAIANLLDTGARRGVTEIVTGRPRFGGGYPPSYTSADTTSAPETRVLPDSTYGGAMFARRNG